ncbi:MAG: HisA/HisF-related TIM barrel protein [Pirellulaceae bacterium]
MKTAAVLDLMNRVVVRGVAGERASYRPIHSDLTRETNPEAVARALLAAFPLETLYIADLDAIAGEEPNWPAYETLLTLGVELWIDAGVADAAGARRLAQFHTAKGRGIDRVIVGLESLAARAELSAVIETLSSRRAVFSLDLKQGRPLSTIDVWRDATPIEIAAEAIAAGFSSLIVLDLAGVGVGRGVAALELCRRIKSDHPQVQLVSGGGVRDREDLRRLAECGCDVALVASALHDGRLSRADLLAAAAIAPPS